MDRDASIQSKIDVTQFIDAIKCKNLSKFLKLLPFQSIDTKSDVLQYLISDEMGDYFNPVLSEELDFQCVKQCFKRTVINNFYSMVEKILQTQTLLWTVKTTGLILANNEKMIELILKSGGLDMYDIMLALEKISNIVIINRLLTELNDKHKEILFNRSLNLDNDSLFQALLYHVPISVKN
jgi:hypothetical protein